MKGGGTILNYEQNKNEPGSYRKLWLLNDSFWEPGWESKIGRAVRRSLSYHQIQFSQYTSPFHILTHIVLKFLT